MPPQFRRARVQILVSPDQLIELECHNLPPLVLTLWAAKGGPYV
jgi:hypothetical protein